MSKNLKGEIKMKIIEKIKEAIHNKFFREVYCSHCGAKGKVVFFKKIKDGSLLCNTCTSAIPHELREAAFDGTLQDYKEARAYTERSKKEFEPVFDNDAGYHDFEVDSAHKLFRVSGSDLIFELSNIEFYSFIFKPEEVKEGFFSEKVKGDVKLSLITKEPCASYDKVIAYGVKAKAEKKLFSSTYLYDNPKKLDEFLERLDRLCELAKQEKAN